LTGSKCTHAGKVFQIQRAAGTGAAWTRTKLFTQLFAGLIASFLVSSRQYYVAALLGVNSCTHQAPHGQPAKEKKVIWSWPCSSRLSFCQAKAVLLLECGHRLLCFLNDRGRLRDF
jgi:hypothetical protein